MKNRLIITTRAAAAAALLLLSVSLQAETVRYEGKPGSKLRIEGTSTVHDWHAETQLVAGFIEFESSAAIDPAVKELPALKVTPKVEASIAVRSLKSSGGRGMDNVMHDAMKANEHQKILYVVKEMTLKPAGERAAGDPVQFDTKGDLTIAGVTKPVSMPVSFENADGGRLKVVGATSLKMTDFGIKPPAPKLALGLISTGDDVKVKFEWLTAKAEPKTAAQK